MKTSDIVQMLIKGTGMVFVLAPFGNALGVDGAIPCLGIAVVCGVQQWQHHQRLIARGTRGTP